MIEAIFDNDKSFKDTDVLSSDFGRMFMCHDCKKKHTDVYVCDSKMKNDQINKSNLSNINKCEKQQQFRLMFAYACNDVESDQNLDILSFDKQKNLFCDAYGSNYEIAFFTEKSVIDSNRNVIIDIENIMDLDKNVKRYAIYVIGFDMEINEWVHCYIDTANGYFITNHADTIPFDMVVFGTITDDIIKRCQNEHIDKINKFKIHPFADICPKFSKYILNTEIEFNDNKKCEFSYRYVYHVEMFRRQIQKCLDTEMSNICTTFANMNNYEKNSHIDNSIVTFVVGNDVVPIFPIRFLHLIKDDSTLKKTLLNKTNQNDFKHLNCGNSFRKLLFYIYSNRLPKMTELINDAIISDIEEINIIMDYINVYGFTEYIRTICASIGSNKQIR